MVDGISVDRYTLSHDLFAKSEENKCFCKLGFDEDPPTPMCPPDGTLDLQPCVKGPVLLSNPHFLYGDKTMKDYVTGLEPKVEVHGSFVDIEPVMYFIFPFKVFVEQLFSNLLNLLFVGNEFSLT